MMAIQKFTVSRDDTIYEAWPDLVKTKSGRLICVFSECTAHVNRENQRLVYCISTDKGRTWSEKRVLAEGKSATDYFNCARISALSDGRIAIICDRMAGQGFEDFSRLTLTQYLWFSSDEGETWSEPKILPFFGIVPDKLLELTSGRWIVAAHAKNSETGKLEEGLWYSDDQGETWSDRIVVASDARYNLCEVSIVEVEDNTLVAFLRENSFMGYDIMKAISYDGGETWSDVYPTPMACGHRPTAGCLNGGSLLVTYRFIPGNHTTYHNTFVAMLAPDGLLRTERNAQGIRTMPLDYDRNLHADTGYTGWVQFDDGEIYVVNYIKDDSDKAQIRGYSFYPTDILLP